MGDGIAKGIGEQLGQLGKQIISDIAKVPAQITGLDRGTDETVGQGTGGKKTTGITQQKPPTKSAETQRIEEIVRQDEAEKQKKLAEARRLLQQFIQSREQPSEPTLREKMELEEMEKKKKEIEEEKIKAQKQLPVMTTRRPQGDLYGIKAKKFGGEVGKNARAQ